MLRRLWSILGPIFVAGLMVLVLLFVYPSSSHLHHLVAEKKDAVTISETNFKNSEKKIRAFTDPEHTFVPFFGSSEWSRFDLAHPSVLSEGYERPYTPYLLGERGTASLSHYFAMQPISKAIEGKKVVFVISPQWFTKKGINTVAFKRNFSSQQLVDFLNNQTGTVVDRYVAKRLLAIHPDVRMKTLLEKVEKGQALSNWDKQLLTVDNLFLEKEEAVFGNLSFLDKTVDLSQYTSQLPQDFSYQELAKRATEDASKQTTTNSFDIKDSFYSKRLKKKVKELKGFQKNDSYLQSTEYNDLQAALSQLAQMQANVLFVIPPVNGKWASYTDLSQDMYQETVKKITYQLQSQGFTHIADFSRDGNQAFFMQDTIHMGWMGWLAFDKAVYPFLTSEQSKPTYQLNDAFLDKAWAQYTGKPDEYGKSDQ